MQAVLRVIGYRSMVCAVSDNEKGIDMNEKVKWFRKIKRELPLHLMLLPGVILIFIFHYIPLYGIVIAFQNFKPAKGLFGPQEWVGFDNFSYLFSLPNTWNVIKNTVTIACWKIVLSLIVPIIVALLLNEMTQLRYKKVIQTVIYFPHFISWIILSGIMFGILSPTSGIINQLLQKLGFHAIYFLGDNRYFQGTVIVSSIWKGFGYGTIVYLASLMSIDPTLYDAAAIDGAGRLKQTWHITLPGMRMIIVLMMVLKLGDVLDAGFGQILNLYSPAVYETGDILDTMIYRIGLAGGKYGAATAAGLLKALVSSVLISVSYWIAYKFFDYKLF